jgi:hypothetical protein
MSSTLVPRLGAACGVLFAVVLFVASGSGDEAYLAPRAVAGLAALALFIPFLAYLCQLLRTAEGADGWLATTALIAGTVGITIKIVSTVPALALHHEHIADGTQLHTLFDALDNGATVIALYPLAIACAAIAAVALRTGALPRWLAGSAAITALALAVNGAFLEASFVPALLLFIVWTFAASVHLLRRAWREPARLRAQTVVGN